MIVFISSVRRGLEDERDYLPGLLKASGHVPRRFEDFSAQPFPSRDACLAGVEAAEVYLLLLGHHYGEPLPGTGKSPTEEEYTVARRRGVPIVVWIPSWGSDGAVTCRLCPGLRARVLRIMPIPASPDGP